MLRQLTNIYSPFREKYYKYDSSFSQALLLTSIRDNLKSPAVAAIYFQDILPQIKLNLKSLKSKKKMCFYSYRDYSPRGHEPSLKASPAFPLTQLHSFLCSPCVFYISYVLLTHNFGFLLTCVCILPRVISYIMVPQDAYILISETYKGYFIWQKRLHGCDQVKELAMGRLSLIAQMGPA